MPANRRKQKTNDSPHSPDSERLELALNKADALLKEARQRYEKLGAWMENNLFPSDKLTPYLRSEGKKQINETLNLFKKVTLPSDDLTLKPILESLQNKFIGLGQLYIMLGGLSLPHRLSKEDRTIYDPNDGSVEDAIHYYQQATSYLKEVKGEQNIQDIANAYLADCTKSLADCYLMKKSFQDAIAYSALARDYLNNIAGPMDIYNQLEIIHEATEDILHCAANKIKEEKLQPDESKIHLEKNSLFKRKRETSECSPSEEVVKKTLKH